MTNLRNAETRFTVRDSVTFTGVKCSNWYGYHKHERKILFVRLSYTTAIPFIHVNLFSMTPSFQKNFQLTPEGEALISNKKSIGTFLDKKIPNN